MLINGRPSLVAIHCLAATCSALLLYPLPLLATDLDFGGHLKYFFNYADYPDQSVFADADMPCNSSTNSAFS